jgi:mono/diheme cytochrome c family protein
MQALVSSLWAAKFFEDSGRAKQGAGVFTKNCAVCHNNPSSGAPHLPAATGEFGGASMIAALWVHGPAMFDQIKAKGIAWPHFDGVQMADLIAYLNTKNP